MQVCDFLQAQPAELSVANGTGHVIAAPVVHFHDEGTALRARLHLLCSYVLNLLTVIYNTKISQHISDSFLLFC